MSGGGGNHSVDYVRKALIVAVLFGGVLLLYRYAVPATEPDPTGLLALGFVVLAAYTIGELVEIIKLPHITGYLLAGLALGPSIAHTFHLNLPPPFDHGLLNEDVIRQLGILDTLALPLICLTAGGALDTKEIRKAIRPILGIMTGQTITMFIGCIGLLYLISGPLPFLTMPQLVGLDMTAILALGAVVASVSLATSDAATIAIIVSTRSQGPLTTNALSVAVLKDVLVVVCFSASTAFAVNALGTGADASFMDAIVGIGLSVVMGVALGVGIHLYLKYIAAELLLFLVGMIYTMSFVADEVGAESALMFIAAGFIAANFSPFGEKLIAEVERLSMPVFVVFFTIAGAKLHLDVLARMAAFGIALVVVRAGAFYIGCRVGAIVGNADPMSRKYVWMTYISQAGLAITLANKMPGTYGESVGGAMFSFLLAAVAVHELIGPAALQYALGKAGEIPQAGAHSAASPDAGTDPHAEPERAPAPSRWAPTGEQLEDPWGAPPDLVATEVATEVAALEARVRAEVEQIVGGPLVEQQRSVEQFLRDLQRVFLRHHRPLLTGAASAEAVESAVAALAGDWRRLLAARAAGLSSRAWDPMRLVLVLDQLAEGCTASHTAVAVEPETLAERTEPRLRALRRRLLRASRRVRRPTRTISLRELTRYHLSGLTPGRLETLAAGLSHREILLAETVESLFDRVAAALRGAAHDPSGGSAAMGSVRRELDDALGALLAEQQALAAAGQVSLLAAVGAGVRGIKADLRELGTLDLPTRSRRFGLVFQERNHGLRVLTEGRAAAQSAVLARTAAAQMHLELAGHAVQVHALAHQHGARLAARVQQEGSTPLQGVTARLSAELAEGEQLLLSAERAADLSTTLRSRSAPLLEQVSAAVTQTAALRALLQDAEVLRPLLDDLRAAVGRLSESYAIPEAPLALADPTRMMPPVAVVEVPLRRLATATVEASLSRSLLAVLRDLGGELGEASRQLEELQRVVPFNLDLACAELDALADGAAVTPEAAAVVSELLLGAIGRSQARMARLAEGATGWPGAIRDAIDRTVEADLHALGGLLQHGQATDLRQLLLREAAVRDRIVQRAEEWGGLVSQAGHQLEAFARRAVGEDRLLDLRHRAGLPVPPEAPLREALAPPRLDHSPAVYRRLFTGEGLSAAELMIGRETFARDVQAALSGGGLRAAAVLGPRGSGTSTLATLAVQGQGRARRLHLRQPATVADIERWLADLGEGSVVLIEGLEWTFTLTPGGAAPLQRLVQGVLEDGGRRGWVLSACVDVWTCAARLAPLHEAFPVQVHLPAMSPALLQKAVLTRHAMSGYDLRFEVQDDIGWQWRYLTGAGGEARAQQAWFATLHDASRGVMRDALRLWLAAIREVDEERGELHMGPVPRPPSGRLSRLPEPALLTLRQVFFQGWMEPALLARIFQVSEAEAHARLVRLAHDGLLEQNDEGRFLLVRHLHTPLRETLQMRGWL